MIKGTITAKPQVFAAAVKWAAKFIEPRPAAPIQGGLMLSAEGGRLVITSMNENVSARATLDVGGDGDGTVVVSGRLLNELVSTFPDKPVEISGDDETVHIAAGRWHGTMPVMNADDYPSQPASPARIGWVSGDGFAAAVAAAAAATSKTPDAAIAWKSLHVSFGEESVRIVGTDSYRAASALAGFEPDTDGPGATALVLAPAMVDVAASFIGPDQIAIGLDDAQISLTSATRSVVMRQHITEYNITMIRKLIDQEQPEHATVKVADLASPLKRAAIVRAKDGPIAVGFAADMITLAAQADELKQDGAEEIDATYAGPEKVLHFNPKYFAEALASAPGSTVDIALTDREVNGRPGIVVLTAPGDAGWRHVLMPIKPLGK